MNKEKFHNLVQYLHSLGFGKMVTSGDELVKYIDQDVTEFQLTTSISFNELTQLTATLYFRKSIQWDEHFLLKYTATLHYLYDPERNRSQTFYAYDNVLFTLEEAFNLLEGRYVYKNQVSAAGEKYSAWLQLNFRETDDQDSFKFNRYISTFPLYLENVLSFYPILELGDDKVKEELLASLKKGNRVLVHFSKPSKYSRWNKIEPKYIEANPRNKSISIFSANIKKTKNTSDSKRLVVNS